MKQVVLTIFGMLSFAIAQAQVGIGTSSVNSSAKLQVDATNKGFLPPRVSLTGTGDVTTIATPATGLMVYNLATSGTAPNNVTPGFYYYDGSKWQRVINQQPDATVEFDKATPTTSGVAFAPNIQNSKDYIYVSTADGSQWTSDGTSYSTYTPPASTPWYLSTGTSDAGSNKTGKIYRTGNVGIGTTDPGNKLEIKAATANTSGLKFTNLTSSSPTSSGATLGVDGSGNVITVTGSSFTPEFGTARPSSTITVDAGNSLLLQSVSITATGTYLIVYTMRVQASGNIAGQYATGFLSTDNVNAIVGTEILGAFPGNAIAASPGGNFTGTHILNITSVPSTIYFRARAANGQMLFYDDVNGRTKITYAKITP